MYVNEKMRMRTVETLPGMGVWGNKGEWWREWIQVWYIVRTFVNAAMYPPSTIKKTKCFVEYYN
jgi:hypothetical protein